GRHDDALLGRAEALQHAVAIDRAGVLLDHVVARAGRVVIGVRPDGDARVVREQRAPEDVAIERPGRVRAGADRVTHRVQAADAAERRRHVEPALGELDVADVAVAAVGAHALADARLALRGRGDRAGRRAGDEQLGDVAQAGLARAAERRQR